MKIKKGIIKNLKGVIFDLETTGLSANSKIIEFAGYKIDLISLDIIDKIHFFINPERTIPLEIIKLTNYDVGNIDKNPTFNEVKVKIINFFKDVSLNIGQNIQYDIGILYNHLNYKDLQIILPYLSNPIYDTMLNAKNIVKAKNQNNRLKNPTLEEIAQYFNIPLKNNKLHNALYDVDITYQIFKKLSKIHNTTNIPYKD